MKESLIEEIAKRLRISRKAAGYKSAKDFALKYHIPTSTYSQHETGKRSIHAELILVYCTKLKINPEWLLTGSHTSFFEDKISLSISEAKNNDTALLKKILLVAQPLFSDKTIKLSYPELIDYCFEIHDMVSSLSDA